MPGTRHLTPAAPSAGRLPSQRAAAGVVAAYIHELARTQPAVSHDRETGTETASPQRLATAGTRLRAAARRRTRGPGASRPLIVPVACPAA